MTDLWGDVRRDVIRRLEEHAPTVPFEDRVRIAEDAAREVKLDAELFAVELCPYTFAHTQSFCGREGCRES